MNPNNCSECLHKQMQEQNKLDSGWCYMFRREPTEVCMQHSTHVPTKLILTPIPL